MMPSPSAHQTLCADVPIGRVLHRSLLPDGTPLDVEHYLSLNVEFYRRHTDFHVGGVNEIEHRFGLRGPVLELSLQVLVRHLAPWRHVAQFVNDLHQLGDPRGPWPLNRFTPAPGVTLGAVLRLAELSRVYNHNLKDFENFDGAPTRAVFIPREVEQEIREITGQLAG